MANSLLDEDGTGAKVAIQGKGNMPSTATALHNPPVAGLGRNPPNTKKSVGKQAMQGRKMSKIRGLGFFFRVCPTHGRKLPEGASKMHGG
jgi:hypothetical protein